MTDVITNVGGMMLSSRPPPPPRSDNADHGAEYEGQDGGDPDPGRASTGSH